MNIEIGDIIKAQGIRGEVKVKPLVRDSSLLKKFDSFIVQSVPLKVASCRLSGNFAYIQFSEVDDRNKAEALVGKKILVDNKNLPALNTGEFYVGDLLGLEVFSDSGQRIGIVESVENYGSADIITVKGDKIVRFPFLKKLNLTVDKKNGRITINSKVFEEVSVYED